MAGLTSPISASQQFAAVAWLRWRLFVNGFRRKGGAGEIVGRLFLYPIAAGFVLFPILGAGFGSFYIAQSGKLALLPVVFWAAFALQIVISINIAPPGLSFDPAALIRFPLTLPCYVLIRLALGLLSASTVAGTLTLLAAALGLSLARPELAAVAFLSAALLALVNLLLIRTAFAWIDRWLSTRRAREAITGLLVLLGVGFQYLNMTYNTGRRGIDPGAKLAAVRHVYGYGEPVLSRLPPGLAASAIAADAAGHVPASLLALAGLVLFAGLFLFTFGWRMAREYRGENLSESTKAVAVSRPHHYATVAPARNSGAFGLPPAVSACLNKEWLYLRRNTTQFYALLVPLVMVLIIASRFSTLAHSGLVFPADVAYAFLSIAALSYNIFGLDASGIQTYLLAPVPLRTVVVTKNLILFLVTLLQFLLLLVLTGYLYGKTSPLLVGATFLWLIFAVLINTAVGNYRSLTAPKKMDPTRLSRRQASPVSAYIALGLILLLIGIGFGVYWLGRFFALPWLPIPVFAALDLGAWFVFTYSLSQVDALALQNREKLIEELCKSA